MANQEPPKNLYLYWYVQDNGKGWFTVQTCELKDPHYNLISHIEPDWGQVEFDETGVAIASLHNIAGFKQAEITELKAKIQELLCIGVEIQG